MTTALFPGRQLVPPDMPDEAQHRRVIARTLNLAMSGQTNTSMQVTLTANAATTTVYDSRISAQTAVNLHPTTADAAAALATTYIICTDGQAVIHHANNGQTDRIFTMGISG